MNNYSIDYSANHIVNTTTAGNGSVSIDTPMGSGTSISNLIPRCSCCQFCPFTDGAIYTSLPAQIKCTLTDEFHFCDNTYCDVKEKLIPIEWIKKYIAEEGIYPNRELLSVEQADAIERMIENWEKENEDV